MSQLNRNYNYLSEVDGITVWERLRVIRNFLSDRKQALAISELSLETKKDFASEYEEKEWQIRKPYTLKLIDDCKREIAFLETLEEKLRHLAEKERIPGKTDEEMYEINYINEKKEILLLEVKSEIASFGKVTSSTMKTLLKNPLILQYIVDQGFLNDTVLKLVSNDNPLTILNQIPLDRGVSSDAS